MRNKINVLLLSCITGSSLFLTGCGGDDSEKPPVPTGPDAFVAGTHPRFDPIISDVPFNSDLIFAKAAATDGTADVGSPSDAVRAALNVLDGFSTSAYFDILIDGSVEASTALPMQNVFLVEVDTGGKDALAPANIVGLGNPASFDVKVISLDGGVNNAIRIRPLQPLKPKTKYLVFLTDGIKDAGGRALTRSWTYNALRDENYEAFSSLLPVRAAISGWEQLASGFLVATSSGQLSATAAMEKLILTYTFTTTDPIVPLMAMAAPRATIASLQMQAGVAPTTAVANAIGLDNANLLPTPKARSLGISSLTGVDMGVLSAGALAGDVGKLYTGYIKLPYYQTAAQGLPFGEYLKRNWRPDQALASALGITLPADVDNTYNLSYRYPFAAKVSDESVPLQITLPKNEWVPGYAGSASCGQIYASTGYPIVIYVHGITLDRSSVLALGHTLASRCVATVAIDLPLHGISANSAFVTALNVEKSQLIPFGSIYGENAPHERHFNVAGAGGAPAPMNFDTPGAADGSGAQFINLGYLANTRDNNRQAVMDLLNLNASLGSINTELSNSVSVGLNPERVYVVGGSLGGIIGSVFTAVNQAAIANDAAVNLESNLNPIRGIVLSAAGSQVSQILVNSATFAPIINGGLARSGVTVGTSNYERFLYTAQSVLDSADPVNFATILAGQGVPVLLQQVNGDLVIPNEATNAPLAGTKALAALLGAEQLGMGSADLGLGYVKMTAGGHGSLLRPEVDAPQVTVELQTQVVTFVLNDGNVVIGSVAPDKVEAPTSAE